MKLIRSGASCGPDICGKYVFILNGQGFSVHPSIHPSVHPSLRPSARLRQGTPSPSSTAAMRRARPIRSRTPSSDGRHAKVRSGTALRRRRFTTNQSRDRHPRAKRRLRRGIRAANGIRRNRTTMRPRPTDRTGLRFLQRRDRPISTRSMRIIRSKPLSLFCDR